jgi:hypothetical protein
MPPSLPTTSRSGSTGSIHIAWWSTCSPTVALRAVRPPSSLTFTGVDDHHTRSGFLGSTRTCE